MAVSRQIIKEHLEAQNRHYPKRIEQGGQTWYRADPTPHTIITAVGSVEFERCRYRTGKRGLSLFPVDDSLGLVEGHPAPFIQTQLTHIARTFAKLWNVGRTMIAAHSPPRVFWFPAAAASSWG